MNIQKPPGAIEWTRVRNPDGTIRKGYTWNVLGGCFHGCKWTMPDGAIAECYAKTVAENVAQANYQHGFEYHYYHPAKLNEPKKVKDGAGIFLDSMSDAMGRWVKREEILSILEVCCETPQHIYFMLTKNPKRYLEFLDDIPANVWCGVSSPPDFLGIGKRPMTLEDKRIYLQRAFASFEALGTRGLTTWMSVEPLTPDMPPLMRDLSLPSVMDWCVVGAASAGRAFIQPDRAATVAMLALLDEYGVKTFFKGNLRPSLGSAFDEWREAFPSQINLTKQLSLF